jgi:hypothetical protein
MRRVMGVVVAGMLLLGAALPGEAWAGGGPRVRVHVGPDPIWWAPGFVPRPFVVYPPYAPYYRARRYYPPVSGYGPLVYGYAPFVYAPPAGVQQAPPVYGQQQALAPPPSPYWYFCQDAGAYYPYVKECAGGWMKVVPSPESGGGAGGLPEADQD